MKANAVILILLTAVIGLVAAGYLVLNDYRAGRELPVLAQAADFSLSDQQGATFTSAQLKNKVWIASFFFSSCEGVCPTINGAIARLGDKVKDSSQVEFVSMSVDPKKDTVPVLSEYAKRFKADPARWHFLTGPEAEIGKMLAAFKLGTMDDPMQHTSRLVLVDRAGQVRGYYQATDEHALEFLERDLKALER